jgi:xanthine dehydrogenase accessory factor
MTPRDTALRWAAEGRRAMVVEIASTRGSVPREAGTRMLVGGDEVHGTIGGGHLELQALATARERAGARFEQRVALGPSLGQCCGGALTLHFAPLDAEALARWPEEAPLFALQLYGAGHVGRAIVRLLEAEVALAVPGSFFLVLTHSHDLDLRLSAAILRRADFGFFGLIGSATKRARFEHRLAERGLATARMTCPIGVAGIAGKAPEVIAVAAVAQLLQAAAPRVHQ